MLTPFLGDTHMKTRIGLAALATMIVAGAITAFALNRRTAGTSPAPEPATA